MRSLLLLLALVAGAWAQVSPGAHASCQNGTTCNVTIDDRGASVDVVWIATAGAITLTDSTSHSWGSPVYSVGNVSGGSLYCWANPTTSATHTFTVTSVAVTLIVQAFNGTSKVSCPDQITGAASNAATLQAGSLTPAIANSLFISAVTVGTAQPSLTISEGTISETLPMVGGTAYGGALAYEILSGTPATNPTWTWPSGTASAGINAVFNVGIVCAITTSSLPATAVSVPYIRGITSTNCTSPTWSVSSGSLPTGLSLNTSTGVISGTPSAAGTYSFTISVTSSLGNDSKALSIVILSNPVITSLAASPNSPNSILLVWNTTVNTNSQASCGTVSGGPYTYASPTVDPVKTAGNDYYGVTSHSLAVVVPTNTSSTAYYCAVLSTDSSGNTTTGPEVNSGTNAALTNTPFGVVTGPYNWIRFNDQATGANGYPNTGKAYMDDSMFCAWAGDGNNYCSLNDGAGTSTDHGVTFCCGTPGYTASGAVQLTADATTVNMRGNTTGNNSTAYCCGSSANSKPTTYTADGLRSYVEGMQCARGVCVIAMPRAGEPQCTPFVLSRDGFLTTIAPQANTGPSVTGSTFTGPSAGTWGYPTQRSECSLQTYVTNRQFGFAQDWGGTPPTVGHPGYQFPVTHQAGTDAWIYSFTYTSGVENFGLMRTPVNNAQVTEAGQVIAQMYNGSGHGNDGLTDSNWVNVGVSLGRLYNQYPLGRRGSISWIGGSIRRWVYIGFAPTPDTAGAGNAIDGSGGLLIWDIGPYPWALLDAVQVGYLPGDPLLEPTFGPVMASVLESSCKYPADGSVFCMVMCTGNFINSGTLQYGPHYRWVHFVPRSQVITPNHVSYTGSPTTHISNTLDLLYTFDMPVWSTTITDYSPPRASKPAGYLVTGIAAQLVVNDGRGLMGGWPQDGAMGTPTTVTITTPYTAALTNFTLIATFSHNANQSVVANETILDKSDIQIKRNGSSANSWVMKVGGITSSAFSLNTDGAFATLIARRVGNTVTLYSSAGIASNGRFTALTTISLAGDVGTGALGSSALVLGSLTGGTQPLYGTISELAIYSRALTDSELISEVATLRFDMSTRNPIVTLP